MEDKGLGVAVELVVHGLVDPLGDGAQPAVEGEVDLPLVHRLPRGPWGGGAGGVMAGVDSTEVQEGVMVVMEVQEEVKWGAEV